MTDIFQKIFVDMILPFGPRLIGGALLFGGLWLIGAIAARFIRRLGQTRKINEGLVNVVARAISSVCFVLGAISGLGTLGVDVTALVASLGLTGFALGFALKDVISNALAGVLLLLYQPFETGDLVSVKSFEGVVKKTSLRYTELVAEGKTIFVPNSLLFSNAVIVDSREREKSDSRTNDSTDAKEEE